MTFWICGWSTNGLIGTHFIPAAHDHGMPETTSASLLALIGVFDIAGTVASGWLTDRVDSRYLLFVYYFFRGLSLLVVPWLLGPHVHPSLFVFILFYGLDWVATVPPTVALCRQHFGIERSGVVFGWVFASHMVGAGIAASYAGWIRTGLGDYFVAWMTAGALCWAPPDSACSSRAVGSPTTSMPWSRPRPARSEDFLVPLSTSGGSGASLSCDGTTFGEDPDGRPRARVRGPDPGAVRLSARAGRSPRRRTGRSRRRRRARP